mgnify:CR=1 FL=1
MSNEVAKVTPKTSLGLKQVEKEELALAGLSEGDFKEILDQNLGGAEIRTWDFPRYTIPSGGGTSWQPAQQGQEERKEITGVVIGSRPIRGYYIEKYGSGDKGPPDCASLDCISGFGILAEGEEPKARNCLGCPKAQFGSDVKEDGTEGRGQACGQNVLLFVLEPDAILPTVVKLPPTSLKPWKLYGINLMSARLAVSRVVTKLTLRRTQNADSVSYSEVVPTAVAQLSPDTVGLIDGMIRMLRSVVVDNREVAQKAAT